MLAKYLCPPNLKKLVNEEHKVVITFEKLYTELMASDDFTSTLLLITMFMPSKCLCPPNRKKSVNEEYAVLMAFENPCLSSFNSRSCISTCRHDLKRQIWWHWDMCRNIEIVSIPLHLSITSGGTCLVSWDSCSRAWFSQYPVHLCWQCIHSRIWEWYCHMLPQWNMEYWYSCVWVQCRIWRHGNKLWWWVNCNAQTCCIRVSNQLSGAMYYRTPS